MKKVLTEGAITVVIFFLTLFVISQVNWMHIFKAESVTQNIDEKLGEFYWEIFKESEEVIYNDTITSIIDSILVKICNANDFDKNKFKLHVIKKNEINAFALPDGHIVFYTGLIQASENEAEFSGVLCHEMAHVQLDHIMKKLVKEVGLSTLLSMAAGNEGGKMIHESIRVLSSSAYDRKLEAEADLEAVKYMSNSGINPESLAMFLFKLRNGNDFLGLDALTWIQSHPNIEDRVENISSISKEYFNENESILSEETWVHIKKIIDNSNN